MGTMECKFCKTLLPDDSRYCFHCGNWLENAAENTLEPEEVGAHQPLSEEDIPTSIATYNVLTDIHPSQEDQATPDPNATILDSQSNEEETFSAANSSSATVPITDEVVLVAEQDSGELLAPAQEEPAANSADVEEEPEAEQEPIHAEETAAPLSAQPLDEQPTLLSAKTVPLDGVETLVPDAASLEDDDLGNAITEPNIPAVFARMNARQMGDEEELAGYMIPASMSSTPSVSRTSRRPSLSRVITVISTMVILLAAVGGLVITGLPLVHGQMPPVLSVSGSASPGSTLMIHGRNFAPSGPVTVLVDDMPVASATHKTLALADIQMAAVGQTLQQSGSTDATVVREDGSFDKAYTVPDSWQPGSSHTIRATEKSSNGGAVGAQLLVKADDLVQPSNQTPQPGVNPQVTVMPVSTVIPTVPTYPGPPVQPTTPPKKVPTPKPTPVKKPTPKPTPTRAPTPTPEPPTPTPVPIVTPTPVLPTPTPVPIVTPTPVPPTPTPVPIVTPTPVPPTPTPVPVVTPTPEPPTPTPVLPTATPTSPPPIPTETPTSIVPTVPPIPTLTPILPIGTPTVTPTPPGRHHGG